MHHEGHQVLTRARITAICGASMLVILACAVGGSAASAARLTHASHVARSGIPASARLRLLHEVLSAWQITKGEGVTIAILSTRVDRVTGLAGKLTVGPDYAPLRGAPAIDGTVLASLIAGSGPTNKNPFGSGGFAPASRILAETIVDYGAGKRGASYQQDGTWQQIEANAIRYAVNHGASVIVTFEGGTTEEPELDSAVAYAISKKVVVLGTGADIHAGAFPDSLPGVINFSGTTINGLPPPNQAVHSPANYSVLVTAPDNTVYGTGPGNQSYFAYGQYSTIAWVAGTVALIKSVYPQITPAEVAQALATSASYHPAGGYNPRIGFGLINPVGALHAAAGLVKLRATTTAGPGVIASDARFGGPPPGVVTAIQHSLAKLGAYAGSVVVGLALLVIGLVLLRRSRRLSASQGAALAAAPSDAAGGWPDNDQGFGAGGPPVAGPAS
jgi:hypothetical protein